MERPLHPPLDIRLAVDRRRARQPKAAMVLADFRWLTVRLAGHGVDQGRAVRCRATVRGFQRRFHHRQNGPRRLADLILHSSQPHVLA